MNAVSVCKRGKAAGFFGADFSSVRMRQAPDQVRGDMYNKRAVTLVRLTRLHIGIDLLFHNIERDGAGCEYGVVEIPNIKIIA